MAEFEDHETGQGLLELAERARKAPNFIKRFTEEELVEAWNWIEQNVSLKSTDPNGKEITRWQLTREFVLLKWFQQRIDEELVRRDDMGPDMVGRLESGKEVKDKTEKSTFMDKTKILQVLIGTALILLAFFAIFKYGGKMSLPNGMTIEHTASSNPAKATENPVLTSVTVIGTIRLNGKIVKSEDVMRVYVKGNTLVSPVTLDGNAFAIKGVPLPEDKIIRIAIDLKDGQSPSQLFHLPNPKDGVSELGELILTSVVPKSETKKTNNTPIIVINNQNIVEENSQNKQGN